MPECRARAADAHTPSHPNALTPTPWNLACSSIAGRRASGFLQVSLSKVSRHGHRGTRPATRAETPPITLTTRQDLSGAVHDETGVRQSLGRHAGLQFL